MNSPRVHRADAGVQEGDAVQQPQGINWTVSQRCSVLCALPQGHWVIPFCIAAIGGVGQFEFRLTISSGVAGSVRDERPDGGRYRPRGGL